MKSSKDIKLIKFLGDSFVWGQGLDNYEYDVHTWGEGSNEFMLRDMEVRDWADISSTAERSKLNYDKDHPAGFIQFSLYPDDIHRYKNRYKSIVEQRWTTTVCDRLGCRGIQKTANGGSISEVVEMYCTELVDTKPDLAIIVLSSYKRDEWGKFNHHSNKDEHLYFNKIKPEIISKVIMRDLVYELWEMADSFELDELKLWYAQQMQKFTQEWFPEHYHREIYIGIFEFFKEIELKYGVPMLFIGSWLEDGEFVFKEEGEIFDWYRDRLIPIKYDGKEFASFYPLVANDEEVSFREKKYRYNLTIGKDFNMIDNHPSKELHDAVANSVIEYLEKEK